MYKKFTVKRFFNEPTLTTVTKALYTNHMTAQHYLNAYITAFLLKYEKQILSVQIFYYFLFIKYIKGGPFSPPFPIAIITRR